ncbi:neck passage structure protein [Lactococcus phage phi15]|uniref:Neck passage structure protein n=2 Tax=Skunavirus TaxID=1623305 RepID=A0A096XV14_9CAUD|nr:neck passage structure protein [Lactococcus phage phi15]AIK68546.1 neck passage structure protein [Lactococcus phage phi15]ALM63737.1 neck passage structure [Lactococcus phage 936 group phage Phi114]
MSLDNFRKRAIVWDTVNKDFPQPIQVMQGDVNARTLSVKIIDNGGEIDLTGHSLKLTYQYTNSSNSGFVMIPPENLTKGEFILVIPTEMTKPGVIEANLVLLNEDKEQVIVSKNLTFISDNSTVTDLAQEVNNKIDDFTKLLLENMPQVMRSELNDLHAQTESNTSNIELKANLSDMTSLQSAMTELKNEVEAFGISPENLVTIKSLLDAIASNASESEVVELINSVKVLTSNISLMSNGDYSPKANQTDLESLRSVVNNQSKTISKKAEQAEIIQARGGQSSLDARLDGLDAKDTDLQSQININKTSISNTSSRIDNLIVTAGNGNSGEVNDLRVDINGLTHATAGDAVRGQLTQIRDTLDSAVKSGLAEYSYGGETEYAINFSATTTNKTAPTQAYTNEFVPIQDVVITKFRLDSYTTSTTFSIFILDNTNKLIASYQNLTPIISNNIATLSSPIEVPKGGKIQIAFLNGTMAFQNVGAKNLTEYHPATGEIVASPIKIGLQWFYKTATIQFIDVLNTNVDKVNTEDYLLPKFKEIEGNYGLVGRWFKKNNGSVPTDATNNQGSIIYTKVSGATQVTVSLTPFTTPNNPYFFAYSIDGGAFTRQNMTNGVIALPNNGEHIIQIVLDGLGENDPVGGGKWVGKLGVFLNGITIDAGEIKGILPKNKVGIYIGDSITEGINVLTTGAIGASNSATGSYTWISSKKLNAIPYYVGYGGTSTLGNASFHKAIEAIDYFYNGVKSNIPDVDFIVMAHGYNDNTLINNGTYTLQQYKDAYNGVMDRLKVKYSGRPIFCVVPFGAQAIKPYIQECIANRPYCYLIETNGISVSTTDGVHPNSAGSIVLGNHIADSIKSKLGTSYFID